MANFRVAAPVRGAAVPFGAMQQRERPAGRLLSAATAFASHAPDLQRLLQLASPAAAMTFSPEWWRAIPAPRGYAHRLLLLRRDGELRAAMRLREKTLFGFSTGILHATDAKGEGLILSPPGTEAEWLAEGVKELFRSRRCTALLLTRSRAAGLPFSNETRHLASVVRETGAEQRTQSVPLFWQTALAPGLDQTLAPLGHRTRRNLRHALRRVVQNGWQFIPQLTSAEVAEATSALSRRSTHPYSREAMKARMALESAHDRSFSMGLRNAHGAWLSLLTGTRRDGGITDIFWQSNVASGHDSVALSMRALLMRFEGERGGAVLRWIGGSSPLLEHCCQAETGTQILVTRPGLRLTLLRRLLGSRFASAANPIQHLLRTEPSGA